MKVAFLAGKLSYGGGERMLNMLMAEFSKRGHNVCVYSWEKEWQSYSNPLKYQVTVLLHPPIGLKGKWVASRELNYELQKDTPDCIIVFALGLAEIAVFVAKTLRIPCICSERVDPYVLPTSLLHRFLRNIVYRTTTGVVFQTNEVRNYFPKRIAKKSVVIPNPIMDDDLPQSQGEDNCRKEIVAIGRLSEEKNFGMLLDAFSEIASQLPDYSLRIFGEGPLFETLKDRINSLGMNGRIRLEGKVNRVVDYIKDSDIFVLSSDHEGMPNALLESMAMGLACISTDFRSGGAKALINNRVNGLLIPVNDKEALKAALLALVNDVELKRAIKRNASNIRISNSKEIILPMWIDFAESLL